MKKHKHEIFLFSAASTASCFILKESIKEWKKALFPQLPSAQMAGFLPFQFIFFSLSNQFMYFIGDVKTETTYSIIICIMYIHKCPRHWGQWGGGNRQYKEEKKHIYYYRYIFKKFYILHHLVFIIYNSLFLKKKNARCWGERREGERWGTKIE